VDRGEVVRTAIRSTMLDKEKEMLEVLVLSIALGGPCDGWCLSVSDNQSTSTSHGTYRRGKACQENGQGCESAEACSTADQRKASETVVVPEMSELM